MTAVREHTVGQVVHDVESCVRRIAGVDSTCVALVRIPDTAAGTGSAAVLFALAPATQDDAEEVCARIRRATLTRFGFLPASVVPLEPREFPRNSRGKIRRGALRARFLRGALNTRHSAAGSPGPASLDEAILRFFRRALSETAEPDSDFLSLGGNSLLAAELASALQADFNVRLPPDALFRWPTPRQLAAALMGGEHDAGLEGGAGIVALNRHERGCPLFLVPGLVPAPWEYQPLLKAAKLTQPVYGLRCPDLEWARDVMTLDEMIAHYVTAIRQVRPRGPYALLGFSWGGVVAFEIANRLLADDQEVRRLIMLDTFGPYRPMPKLLRPLNGVPWRVWLRSFVALHGLAGPRVLSRLGAPDVGDRVALALGTGPLTPTELRRVLKVASSSHPGDDVSFEALCSEVVVAMKSSMSEEDWLQTREARHLPPDDPCAIVKFWKVLMKNRRLAYAHRPTAVFPGTITIYACSGNTRVLRWQRFSRKPLEIEWLPATATAQNRTPHNAFLDPDNVELYAGHLQKLMETASLVN